MSALAKHLPVAVVGMLAFIALPFGGTAARFALWLKSSQE